MRIGLHTTHAVRDRDGCRDIVAKKLGNSRWVNLLFGWLANIWKIYFGDISAHYHTSEWCKTGVL